MDRPLCGTRILIVEDEAIIAFDLAQTVLDAGGEVVGPEATLTGARRLASQQDLSAAILDIRLGDEYVDPLARDLSARGIPFLFHSGHERANRLLADWPDRTILSKPVARSTLISALVMLIRGPPTDRVRAPQLPH
jgi:DNA-binding response OmpR family regulator